ncbi:MAG: SPOR domain-containing protein [Sulfuricaulis sp.]|uniref:SPOR domain-containing protein n=1 Tax=Sulfuricaulis sp. TaxID=2003553 RepID=UPI0034A3A4FE
MAERDDAGYEVNPKYRIVGAIILVSLVVIFVPMVLNESEPPPELKARSNSLPQGNSADTRVIVSPVTPEAPRAVTEGVPNTQTTTPAIAATSTSATKIEPKTEAPATQSRPLPAPEKPNPTSTLAENITKGWIVQVGTFTHIENAVRLRDKLKKQGHTVLTETTTVAGKKALRLRVGPFQDKEQASQSMAKIRKETGVKAVVKTYP